MKRSPAYGADFFSGSSAPSLASADVVVPLLLELFKPTSVLDVGCGLGEWLYVFRQRGVSDICGIDAYASEATALMIDPARLLHKDLNQPLALGRRFDLVLSLEVAEHLLPSAAETFIESLTEHGDIVVFSAAVPGQGGYAHVNEQWLEYWSELFNRRGYLGFDILRPRIWRNTGVAAWYRQNVVAFVNAKAEHQIDRLRDVAGWENRNVHSMVHPETLLNRAHLEQSGYGVKYALRLLARALTNRLGLVAKAISNYSHYPPRK